ncbi:transglycosylase SLT domain-containing protein [Gracilibacillus salitolerans]|uniref:Transglycosylase SLT domain-containing protein n=1 Tax=Gracilibacillus salitolerans TaxID=2663022 RepID=A0A5Q2TVR9_9BACI|nr:transglycosylase SLT domain-containing protein [Gracilibacillus salitolerans]
MQEQKYEKQLEEIEKKKDQTTNKKELIELTREESEKAAYKRAYSKAIEYKQENTFIASYNPNTGHDLQYIDLYKQAAAQYKIDWTLLAAVHDQETNFSNHATMISSAGALGHMQFMPGTWEHYGVDANGNGKRDPYEIEDAIFSAANYLAATGAAKGEIKSALWAYNHSTEYGLEVMAKQEYYKNNYQEERDDYR